MAEVLQILYTAMLHSYLKYYGNRLPAQTGKGFHSPLRHVIFIFSVLSGPVLHPQVTSSPCEYWVWSASCRTTLGIEEGDSHGIWSSVEKSRSIPQ